MPVVRSNPPRAARAPRRGAAAANPPYANVPFVNPTYPSILSVAHDEADGGALFVITDRPCELAGAGNVVPLGVGGLAVLAGAKILPVKFRFALNGAVPQGAAWQWGTGPSNLFDAATGLPPNAGVGNCADFPGPYTPPGLPHVVSTAFGGTTVNLTFDQPVTVAGGPPDDAVTVNGMTPNSASSADAYTISLAMPDFVNAGDPWVISRQPDWVETEIAVPEDGTL